MRYDVPMDSDKKYQIAEAFVGRDYNRIGLVDSGNVLVHVWCDVCVWETWQAFDLYDHGMAVETTCRECGTSQTDEPDYEAMAY